MRNINFITVTGIITSYSLFQNDVLIAKGTAIFSHTLTDLLPYSLHVFKLEVCTVQGCGYSDSVSLLIFYNISFLISG